MTTVRQYTFSLYFNYGFKEDNKLGREWAEKAREGSLAYLKRLFESKAQFSCIAKDEAKDCLLLRGFMHLNSPCTQAYARRLLGKYSACRPSFFGDLVNLCRLIHVGRDLTVTGRLPNGRGNSVKQLKSFASDPKFVVKILLDSIDKKDIERELVKEESE
jgi:hypothetical protein